MIYILFILCRQLPVRKYIIVMFCSTLSPEKHHLCASLYARFCSAGRQLRSCFFFFYAFLILSGSPAVCVHIWCNRIFPFSPLLPFAPTAVYISHDAPWPMPDRQVMNWRKSTSVQSRANHRHRQPHPYLSSVSLFLLLLLSPLSLSLSRSAFGADSLAPAPWRHPHSLQPSSQPSRRRWGGFHGDGISGLSVRGGSQLINPGAGPGKSERYGVFRVAADFFSGGAFTVQLLCVQQYFM